MPGLYGRHQVVRRKLPAADPGSRVTGNGGKVRPLVALLYEIVGVAAAHAVDPMSVLPEGVQKAHGLLVGVFGVCVGWVVDDLQAVNIIQVSLVIAPFPYGEEGVVDACDPVILPRLPDRLLHVAVHDLLAVVSHNVQDPLRQLCDAEQVHMSLVRRHLYAGKDAQGCVAPACMHQIVLCGHVEVHTHILCLLHGIFQGFLPVGQPCVGVEIPLIPLLFCPIYLVPAVLFRGNLQGVLHPGEAAHGVGHRALPVGHGHGDTASLVSQPLVQVFRKDAQTHLPGARLYPARHSSDGGVLWALSHAQVLVSPGQLLLKTDMSVRVLQYDKAHIAEFIRQLHFNV